MFLPARSVALLLVVPFLTFASALAPQHVHEGDDHHHAVAHSHFGPHHAGAHDANATEIEHGAEHVVWLDGAMLHQSIDRAAHVPPALPVCEQAVPSANAWSVRPSDTAAPAHGPPRRSTRFRGPPFLV